jgi:membrane-bound lytic murein transglycosylase B
MHHNSFKLFVLIILFITLFAIVNTQLLAASLAKDPKVQDFINNMVNEHDFNRAKLEKLFNQVEIRQSILDAMSRPAERTKPWYEYRQIFLTDKRIKQGAAFWTENRDIINYAEKVYGVAPEIIVAIIGVETFYGKRQGTYRVMDALSTLAFKYPKRSKFFTSELEHFLIMSKEQDFDPLSKTGSYAGAMGMGQFIPSSFQSYAVDFNGDGTKNIWTNHADAIGSVANYFKRHGWTKDRPVTSIAKVKTDTIIAEDKACRRSCKPEKTVAEFSRQGISPSSSIAATTPAILLVFDQRDDKEYWLGYNNFYVISRYNHSSMYSMAVYQLSQEIKKLYIQKSS